MRRRGAGPERPGPGVGCVESGGSSWPYQEREEEGKRREGGKERGQRERQTLLVKCVCVRLSLIHI